MSIPPYPKNLQVYIVMIVLFGGGTLFNTTNTGITTDKIDAIEQRIEKLEDGIIILLTNDSDHEKLFAHSGNLERTDQLQEILDKMDDRIIYLERLQIDGGVP